jgi:diguanylate cyclase (GGDEF)-like protein
MATSTDRWSAQQLTEFLAVVSSVPERATATREALERSAEALEAELGAFVRDRELIASIGFAAGQVPAGELVAAATGGVSAIDLPGLGSCAVATVRVDGDIPGCLLLARIGGEEFSRDDVNLLRGMSRVLTLTLQMLRLFEDERALREESDRQAADNARLLASLEQRRNLLDELARLQHSMSHRRRLQEVLDAIAHGGGDLLGERIVALRMIDTNDPSQIATVASRGLDGGPLRHSSRAPRGRGIAGRAVSEDRLVMGEAGESAELLPDFVAEGAKVALAVPVHEHGTVVGSLAVASADPERRFSPSDQETLLAYAEHASLALAAAKTVDTMRQAFTDSLTGLANRALFLERLEQALVLAEREGTPVAVLFLDLDRFKLANDSLGHSAGDELLIAAAERIRGVVRGVETVARLGGDEFAVLLEGGSTDAAISTAERIQAALQAPVEIADREVFVSASIGIATGDGTAKDLLRDADVAMYRAKALGKGRYQVFESGMHAEVVQRLELEADIQRAVERDELVVHYQPIVTLPEGRVVGVEALVRWCHPTRGLVAPAAFIPVAEETGQILEIGAWVLREACRQAAAWQAELGDEGEPLRLSVNLSGLQLAQPSVADDVRGALEESRLAPGSLVLELTETVIMQDTEASIARLRDLKELDVRIAVDDFGTGYSSLRYLQRFPIDILKIAKPFVDGVAEDSEEAIMARAIADLSRNLGLSTIAEGIEHQPQADALHALGCPLGQGYLFSRPVPGPELTALLLRQAAAASAAAPASAPSNGTAPDLRGLFAKSR